MKFTGALAAVVVFVLMLTAALFIGYVGFHFLGQLQMPDPAAAFTGIAASLAGAFAVLTGFAHAMNIIEHRMEDDEGRRSASRR